MWHVRQLYYNTLEAIKAVVDLKAKTVVAQEKSVIDEGIANALFIITKIT